MTVKVTKREDKYVLRHILPLVTHIYVCPNGCEQRPENKICYKRSESGLTLQWYCGVCYSELDMEVVTGKIRKERLVKVFAVDCIKEKGVR